MDYERWYLRRLDRFVELMIWKLRGTSVVSAQFSANEIESEACHKGEPDHCANDGERTLQKPHDDVEVDVEETYRDANKDYRENRAGYESSNEGIFYHCYRIRWILGAK